MMEMEKEVEQELSIPSQVTGFRVGENFYAISVLDIQEVVRPHQITPVPLSPPFVKGLINLRGQIVTSISLRTLFGLDHEHDQPPKDLVKVEENSEGEVKEEHSDDIHMNVILKHNKFLFSLIVDEILDVVDVSPDVFEQRPGTIDDELKPYVKGVYKLPDKLLVLLDLDKILNINSNKEDSNAASA